MAHVNLHTKGKLQTMAEINMVPFIDVVLVLLIIFMVLMPALVRTPQHGIEVSLAADARAQVRRDADGITIRVLRSGACFVDGRQMSLDDLVQIVKAGVHADPSQIVFVSAEQEALHGHVAKVIAACKRAGVKKVRIGY